MQNIKRFLSEYIEDPTYNYAVMINGDWGTGKTFFIKKYMLENGEGRGFIYVSLYGVKSIEEISKDIYLQIIRKQTKAEKIEDKKINIIGSIVKKIIADLCEHKGVDLKGINEIYGQLIDLKKYIFIFDDLERNSMELNQILGYINRLVEHDEIKAIIIANDQKIEDEKYLSTKEKLVSNTILYKPEIQVIFRMIIEELEETNNLKDSLIENIDFFTKNENGVNIRTYQFFLSKYRKVYAKLIKIYGEDIDERILKKIIEDIYSSSIRYKKGEKLKDLSIWDKYVYSDDITIDDVKAYSRIYLESLVEEKKENDLSKLSSWSILEDEEVENILKSIIKDVREDKYTAEEFIKIIRIIILLEEVGFKKCYMNNIITEMKTKAYSINDLNMIIDINSDGLDLGIGKNKELRKKFRATANDVKQSLQENLNKENKSEINNILTEKEWIKKLDEYLERNKVCKSGEGFALCEIEKLKIKIEEINNEQLRRLRWIFDKLEFTEKNKEFLERLENEINDLNIAEYRIIRKQVLEWFKNDVQRKIESLK